MEVNPLSRPNRPNRKVLILFPSLDSKGGVVNFCQRLTENLSAGFRMDHLSTGNRPGHRSLIRRFGYFLRDSSALKQKLKTNRFDLVHLNPSLKIFALLRDAHYLSLIRRRHEGKIVVMFHGWDEALAEKISRHRFLKNLFGRIFGKANLILVLSQAIKSQLVKMGVDPETARVVTTMYRKSPRPAETREDKPEEISRILFMARLIKAKGVYVAAEVGERLVRNGYTNFKLFFAGDGPELEGLKKYIREHSLSGHLEALGHVSGRQKDDLLAACHVFLLPSTSEGCPVAVLEAMGAGSAIVGTAVGAVPEIIEQGKNGMIVRSGDANGIYLAVRELLENKELLREIRTLNRNKAEELYEERIVTAKFSELYLSLIEG